MTKMAASMVSFTGSPHFPRPLLKDRFAQPWALLTFAVQQTRMPRGRESPFRTKRHLWITRKKLARPEGEVRGLQSSYLRIGFDMTSAPRKKLHDGSRRHTVQGVDEENEIKSKRFLQIYPKNSPCVRHGTFWQKN